MTTRDAIQRVGIFGATGSIGTSTLDVIARNPDRYEVTVLAAHSSAEAMAELCWQHRPKFAHMADPAAAEVLEKALIGSDVIVCSGSDRLEALAGSDYVDSVMAAIVGAAGLSSTLAAARAGKKLLLANKESLVMAGALLMNSAEASGSHILPIDSEHNAIFQCLEHDDRAKPCLRGVESIILTASGGPFRTWSAEAIAQATPEQAIAHPNWSMGAKISVDSASLMNKGLELIEASWLFDMHPSRIEVLVHPQSIIHSMVRYCDGSVLSQMGLPDMRTPIAYGLGWPERTRSGVSPLDFCKLGSLTFEEADLHRFPCLRLAREAATAGGTASALCNAANEVAVAAFLQGDLQFGDIPRVVESVLIEVPNREPSSLTVVLDQDLVARDCAQRAVAEFRMARRL